MSLLYSFVWRGLQLFLDHSSQDIWAFELSDVYLDYFFLDFPTGECIALCKTSGVAQNAAQRGNEKAQAMKLMCADVSCQGNDKGVKYGVIFSDKKEKTNKR